MPCGQDKNHTDSAVSLVNSFFRHPIVLTGGVIFSFTMGIYFVEALSQQYKAAEKSIANFTNADVAGFSVDSYVDSMEIKTIFIEIAVIVFVLSILKLAAAVHVRKQVSPECREGRVNQAADDYVIDRFVRPVFPLLVIVTVVLFSVYLKWADMSDKDHLDLIALVEKFQNLDSNSNSNSTSTSTSTSNSGSGSSSSESTWGYLINGSDVSPTSSILELAIERNGLEAVLLKFRLDSLFYAAVSVGGLAMMANSKIEGAKHIKGGVPTAIKFLAQQAEDNNHQETLRRVPSQVSDLEMGFKDAAKSTVRVSDKLVDVRYQLIAVLAESKENSRLHDERKAENDSLRKQVMEMMERMERMERKAENDSLRRQVMEVMEKRAIDADTDTSSQASSASMRSSPRSPSTFMMRPAQSNSGSSGEGSPRSPILLQGREERQLNSTTVRSLLFDDSDSEGSQPGSPDSGKESGFVGHPSREGDRRVSGGLNLGDLLFGYSAPLENANPAEHESGRSSPAEFVVLEKANPLLGSPSRGGLSKRTKKTDEGVSADVSPPAVGSPKQ